MGEYRVVNLKKIKPSKNNYRKHSDKHAQEELTESVISRGVLQPILVRPLSGSRVTGYGSFEIVAGHRRYDAAVSAKLKEIPAIIRELSDEDALEIQVIENSQREDPNPMDESEGFNRLLEMGKHTVETLAEKLGKSPGYVYTRLRFQFLHPDVKQALADEAISIGHAQLIIRLNNPGVQAWFLEDIVENNMSVKEARENLEYYTRKIKEAVFKTDECEQCPNLTRNQVNLFPDIKDTDACMDGECFYLKTRQYYEGIILAMTGKGFTCITDRKEGLKHADQQGSITRIQAPGTKGSNHCIPKKYKSQCMKCTENHVYFFFESEDYSGRKSFQFGETCTDPACLKKMQHGGKDKKENAGGSCDDGCDNDSAGHENSTSNVNPHTLRAHARNCRDRFLKDALPGKVKNHSTLINRLLLYHLIDRMDSFKGRASILKKYYPEYGKGGDFNDTDRYHIVSKFDPDKLLDAQDELVTAAIDETDTDVLLMMCEEAGIDMTKDFGPDEEFLNTKTQAELLKFIKDHKLALTVTDKDKKGDIVKAIMVKDLKGEFTPELEEAIAPYEADTSGMGITFCHKCGVGDDEVELEAVPGEEGGMVYSCGECQGEATE